MGFLRRVLSPEQRRLVKFAIVGGTGVVVNLLTVFLCTAWIFAGVGTVTLPVFGLVQPAGVMALITGILVSIFTNFLLNDRWTWGDRSKGATGSWLVRLRDFYLTNGIAAGIQFLVAWMALRTDLLAGPFWGLSLDGFRPTIASLIGIAVATPLNYIINHLWTFRDR